MAKITKPQLVERILKVKDNVELEKDAVEFINYTVTKYNENNRNVTMEDLKDTIAYIEEITGEDFNTLLANAEEVETLLDIVEEPKKDEPKKEENKKKLVPRVTNKENKVKQKEETPKEETKEKPSVEHKKVELLASFPETLESTVLKGTLKLRTDLQNIEDVAKAFNEEQDIIIATYWTKRHLKQYSNSYDPLNINPVKPKEFEHDLDLIEITYANNLVVTGCSLYTYVPQVYLPGFFEIEEDGLRYANGCEFQIYEIVEG